MKRVAGLPSTPDGLLRFRTDKSATQTWTGFGSFEAGAAKRELILRGDGHSSLG